MLVIFAFLIVNAAPPEGAFIAGISTIDGSDTEIVAVLPNGSRKMLGIEHHASGFIPRGSVVGTELAIAVRRDGASSASVVVRDLSTGERRVVGDGAISLQAPVIVDDGVVFVRAEERPERSVFSIVQAHARHEQTAATFVGAWLSPVRGVPERFLEIDRDGVMRIATLTGAKLVVETDLGPGRFRSPAVLGARVVVERLGAGDTADLVEMPAGRVLFSGIHGMDPLTVGDRIVAGAGTKRAGLAVVRFHDDGKARIESLKIPRAGTATPRAGAVVNGKLTVIAWVSRGRSLPGELWRVDESGAVRILEPSIGRAVEVYGFVGAAP